MPATPYAPMPNDHCESMGMMRPKAGMGDAPLSLWIVTPGWFTSWLPCPASMPVALYFTVGMK